MTSLENRLPRTLESRASALQRRLASVANLNSAGVPCGVMVAPIIPMVTGCWIAQVLECAAAAGARRSGRAVLRLSWELKDQFREWLALSVPDRGD